MYTNDTLIVSVQINTYYLPFPKKENDCFVLYGFHMNGYFEFWRILWSMSIYRNGLLSKQNQRLAKNTP